MGNEEGDSNVVATFRSIVEVQLGLFLDLIRLAKFKFSLSS